MVDPSYQNMKNLNTRRLTSSDFRKGSMQGESVNYLRRNGAFFGLIITSPISLLLLVSNEKHWSFSGGAYNTVNKNRASVQLAVQVVSAFFGFLQHNVVCQLFNYGTRLRLRKTPPTLDAAYALNSISAARGAWDLRIKFLLLTLVSALAMLVPSALWAGITPTLIVTQAPTLGSLPILQFQDRTPKGLFSLAPGVRMLGPLLASAASATPVDGSIWQHPEFDNTSYTYNGRSYGV